MLTWFQNLIDPYPEAPPKTPPNTLAAFVWAGTHGVRRYLLCMTSLTALIGAFEALLFAMLGNIVDWLSEVPRHELFAREQNHLLMLAGVLLASPLAVWLQTMLKHQTLAGVFPINLR